MLEIGVVNFRNQKFFFCSEVFANVAKDLRKERLSLMDHLCEPQTQSLCLWRTKRKIEQIRAGSTITEIGAELLSAKEQAGVPDTLCPAQ